VAERLPQSTTFRAAFKAFLVATPTLPGIGLTIAIVLSKNCGAFANPSGGATTATELANGWYYVDLSTTDMNTRGPLIVRGTELTILPAETLYTIVSAHNGGFDGVPDVAADVAGGLSTTTAQAGDAMTLTSGERAATVAAIWAATSRTLSSFGSLVADVWSAVVDSAGISTLLGRLTSTRSGLLDHLDADVSSRLADARYEVPANATIATIHANVLGLGDDTTVLLENVDVPVSSRAAPAEVLAQVRNALDEDTYDLPGQEDLPTSFPLTFALRWLYKLNRNRATQTNDTFRLYNHAETQVDQKATVIQDTTTFARGRYQQGP